MKNCTVLLVEDDADSVRLIRASLMKAGFANPVVALGSAEDAMKYLAGEPPFTDRRQHPFPQLLLLDLKLPGMHGIEFLQWLRASDAGKMLPVVVLTSSGLELDMISAYKAGANSYVTKGEDAHHLRDQMAAIGSIWLRDNRLPAAMRT